MKKLLFLSFIVLFLNSCGGSKKTITETSGKNVDKSITKSEIPAPQADQNLDFATLRYIAKYAPIAKKEMKEYGVPASITMAQGILESQSGKSRLAVEGKNHFGIKCHKDWNGEKILHDDNTAQECFRKYKNPEESFKDHSRFLANRKRYAFLFRLPKTDYEAWARGLKKAGYATDPSYPDKLIYIINKYNLSKMDKEVLADMSVKVEEDNTSHKDKKKKFIYEVKEGETLFTISRKFNVPVKDIQRINNLNDFDIYPGQILVLTENDGNNMTTNSEEISENKESEETVTETVEPVNSQEINTTEIDKKTNEKETKKIDTKNVTLHVVKQGETLFSISKSAGIDINELRRLNNLSGNNIAVGSVIKIPLKKMGQTQTAPEPKVEKTEPVKKEKDKSTTEDNAVYHIVQPGETLYRIHVNYKVSIKQLRKLNHLKGNYIKVGQKLRVK